MTNPYIEGEGEVMRLLVEAYNAMVKLPNTHPCHIKDFADGIHKCQDIIIHRIVQRDYPAEFPSYNILDEL